MQQKDIQEGNLYVHRNGEVVRVLTKNHPLDRKMLSRDDARRNGVEVEWLTGWNALNGTGYRIIASRELHREATEAELESRLARTDVKHRLNMLANRAEKVVPRDVLVQRSLFRATVGLSFSGPHDAIEKIVKALEIVHEAEKAGEVTGG